LPSKGYLYSEESPLSSGWITLKYPTAKEEDILTSQQLIKKKTFIDEFLKALIVDKSINYEDLLLGDVNAIMIAARILAYGPNYQTRITCPSCDVKQTLNIDLSKFQNIKNSIEEPCKNKFELILPISQVKIQFKLLTQGESKEAQKIAKRLKKVLGREVELSTRLKSSIISVNGDSTRKTINDFVDNALMSRDSLALRQKINSLMPNIDNTIHFECKECGYEEDIQLPLGTNFFWPDTEV
jgi:hypothetical protein